MSKADWLIEQLKRDDLPPETRKRYQNRLKMQKPRKPGRRLYGPKLVADEHYTPKQYSAIRKRRKTAQASKRRNRR